MSMTLLVVALAAAGLAAIAWMLIPDKKVFVAVGWFASVCLVPVWFGVSVVVYVMPAVLAGALVLGTLLLMQPRRTMVWTPVDLGAAAFFGCCLLPALVGSTTRSVFFILVSEWLLGFAVGRIMPDKLGPDRVARICSWVFGLVAALALVEFVTGWNPWVGLARANASYELWGVLQERGGILRAEGAFGHSIAMSCCIALAIPIMLGSGLRDRTKALLLALACAGTVVSFSRAGMLCTALAVVLMFVFHRRSLGWSLKAVVPICAAGAGIAVIPYVASIFTAAGSEATGSSAYRGELYGLIADMAPLGLSPLRETSAEGDITYGGFESIDNALVLLGLRYGWIPALILAVLIVVAAGVVLARKATPATISIVASVPALLSVAFITQYGIFFFFVAGLAAHSWAPRRRRAATRSSSRPEITA
ncbi:hypothetical protein [Pseudonocardia sp. WMMC193]|uniref:hypothetical protein n=1 Tax=Pseudonocardia sp. WMMC193 TaxID=2911965 RepID=UPI001F310FD2|nr:hypothetical protein [Pseudonocardia sp. WMMC193]MCF7553845.1 hypothetical protein [Pseudonocardia sp. WMMC193]